jgi:asparagine synthase (glutamine-hydrolysing)
VDSLLRRGLFEPKAVRTLVRQDREGKVDAAYTIFALTCMELWCRIFVDRVPDEVSPHSS